MGGGRKPTSTPGLTVSVSVSVSVVDTMCLPTNTKKHTSRLTDPFKYINNEE
jgi:hypothetical protein